MKQWSQELLDQIDYMNKMDSLPKDLANMYEKLPKKKDGTLNMQLSNKSCYTFIAIASTRSDFMQSRHRIFGLYPELKHDEESKDTALKNDYSTERTEYANKETELKLDRKDVKKVILKLQNMKEYISEIIQLIDRLTS